MELTNSTLHYNLVRSVIDKGYAPTQDELAHMFRCPRKRITNRLEELAADHGVVLHPKSHEVWVIHPFSLAPTNFLVKAGNREWWGNCAWCSLGIAALLGKDATIRTTLGANSHQVTIRIRNGEVQPADLYVHFPIPMKNAWDNVIYTCSTMLVFENERQVSDWCAKHRIGKGDVQPITKVWEFSKVWYGNHLNPNWRKWTMKEVNTIFGKFNLKGPIWETPELAGRF